MASHSFIEESEFIQLQCSPEHGCKRREAATQQNGCWEAQKLSLGPCSKIGYLESNVSYI